MPDTYRRARRRCSPALEKHYRDMQDIEFTIQDGKLWMLQTRSGKRTTEAALKIAVDLVAEGLITPEEAVLRIDAGSARPAPASDHRSRRPRRHVIATGLPASPGAASGEIVFDADEAEALKGHGPRGDPGAHRDEPGGHPRHARRRRHPHHARRHDQPRRGGRARHGAAVRVRRRRAAHRRQGRHHDGRPAQTFRKGDVITIDGATGEVLKGRVKMRQPELSGDFAKVMEWADAARSLGVRANADTPRDAKQARRVRRRGHRAVPHRAHVLRGEPHPRHARDDLRRRRGRPPRGRWPRSCPCSAPISRSCSRSWPGCR